jgi:transcriptional regulator with XRE-family HTH domain
MKRIKNKLKQQLAFIDAIVYNSCRKLHGILEREKAMEYKAREVGGRLKALRVEKRYSRQEIAERIGRSPKYYADIERGICGMSLETLLGLANIYHVSLDYLVEGNTAATNAGTDEEIMWIVKRLNGLERDRRKVVIDMVNLMVDQTQPCGQNTDGAH